MTKPPLCGVPGSCLRYSRRCSFDCVISRWFKSGKAARDLLLKDDDIDEWSLTEMQKLVLTKNHRLSTENKPPKNAVLTKDGWGICPETVASPPFFLPACGGRKKGRGREGDVCRNRNASKEGLIGDSDE